MAEQAQEYKVLAPEGLMTQHAPDEPVEPKAAATVVLLREGTAGPEVFLQRRVAAMAFAAGMTVFPGGGVDSRDADVSINWSGPEPARWARWFGCAEPLARALVCAAVRETFEESGVLLAGDDSGVVADTAPHEWARAALVSREKSLAGFLAESGLTLRADLLRPWANWITPEGGSRRYNTRFFVAALPFGQRADGATTEAERSGWERPDDAIAAARSGDSALMPPTWVTLSEVGEHSTVADVLETHRQVSPIQPTLIDDGDGIRVVLEEP